MPLHDDEMNARRQKREALRRKQQEQAKRMKRRLILAAVLLVLCALGISRLVQTGTQEGEAALQAETTVPTTVATEPTSPVRADPITTIHIRAAGDLNITDEVVTSGVSATGYDYGPAFKDVAAALSDGDLTVLNFEGNVCGEPYGSATTSAPIELIQGLRSAGVDMLQMANSCTINNGLNGLTATLQALRAVGIEPLGAFSSEEEFRKSGGYTMTEVQGIRIAFVAFTKGLGGRGMPAGNEKLVNLLYTDYATDYQKLDRDSITAILKNVEAEKPDFTVAMVHWGSEYNEDISSTQKSLVSLMQKQGVDLILGTHPHLVQAIDFNEAAGTLVAYSLGDFFGDATRGGTNYSLILDIEITKDAAAGTTKVTGFDYVPIYTVKKNETAGDYTYSRVMRIQPAIDAYNGNFLDSVTTACKENMEYALTRIAKRIEPPKEEE